MVAKAVLLLCSSALLIQAISAQCIGYGNNLGRGIIGAEIAGAEIAGLSGYGGCGNNLARGIIGAEIAGAELAGLGGYGYGLGLSAPIYASSASANGGGLAVSSSSPLSPSGISIVSENAIEGALEVVGQLPLLAAVALEGNLPTSGAAGVTYSCGNGNVGITSESLAAAGLGYGNGLAGLNAGLGYGNGLAGLNAGLAGGLGYGNAGLIGAEIAGAGLGSGLISIAPNCGGIYY